MTSRRLFLISLASVVPLSNCASIPPDSTRRPGGVGDATSKPSEPWHPETSAAAEPPKPGSAVPVEEGAYVCPMHPEITRAVPEVCPKCGMKLVPRKEGDSK